MAAVDDAKLASALRWRSGLLAAALLLPLGLFLLFERQARRLDVLGEHGVPVEARVTRVSRDGTFYSYRFAGVVHEWNVARSDAPFAPGEVFPVVVSPDDPSLSRPGSDRRVGTEAAARNRSFSRKVVFGVALALLLFAGLAHIDVRSRQAGRVPDPTDPVAYRKRLALTGLVLVPLVLLVSGLHLQDAVAKGESAWPVVIGLGLVLGILGGVFFSAGRAGPAKAQQRFGRVVRWVAPIAGAIAALRLIAMLVGG